MSREECLRLVREHVKNENLLNHMVGVGAIMRGLGERFGEDPGLWEAVGILHDVDYESFGEDFSKHGLLSAEMVQGLLPEEAVSAIRAHNDLTGFKAERRMEVALLAADAISGMIVANAFVRPTKLIGMKAKRIKDRMKDKSFARQVSRENIMRCEEIGIPFSDFVEIAVSSMQRVAAEIGLSA